MKIHTADDLRSDSGTFAPHLVLLGAGASRAAFETGDAAGRGVPDMNGLLDLPGIRQALGADWTGRAGCEGFEAAHADLAASDPQLAATVEALILDYFSSLQIGDGVNIYDRLLLSLNSCDAIFSFNWDPFLIQAYLRNRSQGFGLPEIFFLHGNVRVYACASHDCWMPHPGRCHHCGDLLAAPKLLYPVRDKDYQRDPIISRAWSEFEARLGEAGSLTIFGYSAPKTDRAAKEAIVAAWNSTPRGFTDHVDVVDLKSSSEVHATWGALVPTHHFDRYASIHESVVFRWPRRVSAGLYYSSSGEPCETYSLEGASLAELQHAARTIGQFEI